jgi:hypothetical protein
MWPALKATATLGATHLTFILFPPCGSLKLHQAHWPPRTSVTSGYYKRNDLNNDETIFTKDGWPCTGNVR